jgi:hypothetical protein
MYKGLGHGFQTTGFRVFKDQYIQGKTVSKLASWSDRHCERCQRFLSKKQLKYCSRCAPIIHNQQVKKNRVNPERRAILRLRNFLYYHASELKVGDIF